MAADNIRTAATTSVQSWDYFNKHVQQAIKSSGNFAAGATTLICAGPPQLELMTNNLANSIDNGETPFMAMPIGMTQNFSVGQQQQIMRVFEIGSWRYYTIAGHTMGSLGLGRVYYSGPSLMKVMYAFYNKTLVNRGWSDLAMDIDNQAGGVGDTSTGIDPASLQIRPGADNFMVNLASDLFKNPIGLLIVFQDANRNSLGACYAENCYITSHSMGVGAESLIISENVQVQFERLVPVKINGKLGTGTGTSPTIKQSF